MKLFFKEKNIRGILIVLEHRKETLIVTRIVVIKLSLPLNSATSAARA